MKMTNTKNKGSAKKKLIPAAGSLIISACMLATSTYAWFTMNKEVSVTGMEVKAHAEEGLLINEVAAAGSHTWDEQATGGAQSAVVLRPASTFDMTAFYHANSKKSYDEAGMQSGSTLDSGSTVKISDGVYYTDVTANATGVKDNVVVPSGEAEGNVKAETHVYYKDASFGGANGSGTYQDGEGFYVKYTYYLKSSGDSDLTADNLQARVKAAKKAGDSGTSTDLEKSLRVGITVPASNADGASIAGYDIFAPVAGADADYYVTKNTSGSQSQQVQPEVATTTGQFTEYRTLNKNSASITIPDVNDNGIPVYVYVWFEGEDTNCMSDNLTDILCTYDIDIEFYDASIF